jgi:hypothetical protein
MKTPALLALAATFGLSALVGTAPAHAAAMSCGDFTLGDATDCAGPIAGNDPFPNPVPDLFGDTWIAIDKDETADENSGSDVDTGSPEEWFYWTAATGEDPNDVRNGTWTLDPAIWSLYGRLAIALKAGNEFSVFVLEQGDLSGIWSSGKGLSHASLYGVEGDDTQLAEPGTLLLLGLGLVAVVFARRRMSR